MKIAEITRSLLNSKQIIAYIVVAIVMLVLGITVEAQLNSYNPNPQTDYFSVTPEAQKNIQVAYSSIPEYKSFNPATQKFPYYIKSSAPSLITFYEDTFFSLKENTELRTINFQKKRLHLELTNGEVLFDNRMSMAPVTIQVGDYFLQPYTKGLYSVNKNQITSLVGASLIGVYKQNLLSKILVLPKGNSITLLDHKINKIDSYKSYTDYYSQNKILNSVDTFLAKQGLFSLNFKGQVIDPLNNPLHSSFLNLAIVNPNKKAYKEFYGFMQTLRSAEINFDNNELYLKAAQDYYLASILKNPSNLQMYKNSLNPIVEQMLGVHPSDDLYNIKLFLITTNKFNSNSVYLSLIEDLDQSYAVRDPENIDRILDYLISQSDTENLKKITPKILELVDNLAFNYDVAYNIKHFELRSKLGKNLVKASDKTIFSTNTNLHLQKIKALAKANSIPNSEIKNLLEFLLKSASENIQLEYQNFLLELTS